jgi:hypothetical protein
VTKKGSGDQRKISEARVENPIKLPGHAVASRMRAKEIFIYIVPLNPVWKTGLARHVPATRPP